MMKKLLLLSSAVFAFSFGAIAQTFSAPSTPTVITDTLRYFLNKQLFKLGTKMDTNYAYYKAPTSASANSHTYVTHCGSIFRNKDTMLMVNGIEGFASKHHRNASAGGALEVHLYLCKVDPVTDLPVLPAIDSVVTSINNSCNAAAVCPPVLLGANFTIMVNGVVTPNPRRVKGDFAVLMRNYSTHAGDTIRFYRTSTLTHGSQLASGVAGQYYQTGENLGVIRKNGVWRKTTHMLDVTGFGGYGTDYEFVVAPRVTFTLQVSTLLPASAASACQYDCDTYTVTSSPEFLNRQFNMHAFYRDLKPFQFQPGGGFYPDTCVQFDFDDDPRIDTLPHLWGRVQNLFLPPGANSMCKMFDTTGNFLNGHQIAAYRKMTGSYYAGGHVMGRDSFAVIVTDCGRPVNYVGIQSAGELNNINVYPNPSVNGKTNIVGLQGKNTITIFDILGQVVSSEVTDKPAAVVDLGKQPAGSYTIRITTPGYKSKVVKMINSKD